MKPNELTREQVEELREKLTAKDGGLGFLAEHATPICLMLERYFGLLDAMAIISAICGAYVEDASTVPSREIASAVMRLQARAVKAENKLKEVLEALPAERAEDLVASMLVFCVESKPDRDSNPGTDMCSDCKLYADQLKNYAVAAGKS